MSMPPGGRRRGLIGLLAACPVAACVSAGAVAAPSSPAVSRATVAAAVAPAAPANPAAPATPATPHVSRTPTPPTGVARPAVTTWQARVAASFSRLAPRLHTRSVGVRIAVVGRTDAVSLGTWRAGPAWSTVKVPLSLAALARANTATTRGLVQRAVTRSDNAAADALWSGLGARRAKAVDAALAAHGDAVTRTQAVRVRPPFSAYGQTSWSLTNQVAFAKGLACATSRADALVKADMAAVTSSQRWGLGRITAARFKGGWGPDVHGRYLVRQFGLVSRGSMVIAVAVAVEPANGSFGTGTAELDQVAAWLRSALPLLPSAARTC